MTMLKTIGTADMTTTGALTGVELNETPFFPGANALLHLSVPVGGAGVITLEGAPTVDTDTADWTAVRTIVAADGLLVEVTGLPKTIRANVSTAGTGSPVLKLEGVQ